MPLANDSLSRPTNQLGLLAKRTSRRRTTWTRLPCSPFSSSWANVHLTCDTGVVLALAITRSDAPLLRGTVALIQPTSFGGEQVAFLLPPPGEAAALPESANVPGWPRAATAAQRHRALRIALPAIGLAALRPFVPSDSATSSGSGECVPRRR